MDKQSKALLVKYTVSRSGLSRRELGTMQGEEWVDCDTGWAEGGGRRSASEPCIFLKPMRKYYYLPNEQAQFLKKQKHKQKNLGEEKHQTPVVSCE